MSEKKESAQLGTRVDPSIAKWIRDTAEEMQIPQGELVAKMQQVFVENDAAQKYPEWAAQIKDVHFWARSLIAAYESQVERGYEADNRAREEMQKVLERKDNLIEEQLNNIKELKEQKKALEENGRKAEDLQRDLDAARARVGEVEFDAKQRMDDLRTTNDSLMGDKKRLEAEVQRYLEQIAGMQAAVASYEAMKAERDAAMDKIEEERRAGQEAQKQAVEATRAAMQEQVNAVNDRLHEAVVAQAAAQAEANSLREFKVANDRLHEVIGEQKAKIAMLETQSATLESQRNKLDEENMELRESNQKLKAEVERIKSQIGAMKAGIGADGQTSIEGV